MENAKNNFFNQDAGIDNCIQIIDNAKKARPNYFKDKKYRCTPEGHNQWVTDEDEWFEEYFGSQ